MSEDGINSQAMIIQKEREYLNETIKCCYLGVVESIDAPYASIKPMALDSDGQKRPAVQKALISIPPIKAKYVDTKGTTHTLKPKMDLKKGDHVVVAVSNNDTSHYSKDRDTFNVFNTNLHSVEDSIIISKIAQEDDFK
ncbi:hypothetical protein [Apilactobacillus timberlakei]|uniref:hypothetical protein n=1 Tax=Apilactobacillus timberlakei TaxID=2008380 RepID=UPI00112BB539|nr:hypothetical protein [Apilactobacillus timberlakei]TPR16637.1 hypothetical protein DYZ95_07285 [Apilactobacillus timberlakei]